MHREKSTSHYEHMIAASSSSNDDDNMSLGAKQEEAPTSTHDTASSSVVSQCRGGVLSQRNQTTWKYEAHWKVNLSI